MTCRHSGCLINSIDPYTPCNASVPGDRSSDPPVSGRLDQALSDLSCLVEAGRHTTDAVQQFRAWTDAIEALDVAREAMAEERLTALARLRREGGSYDSIARATGLHKQRIAQLVRELKRRDAPA